MVRTRALHVVGPSAGGMGRAAAAWVGALRGAGVDAHLVQLPELRRALAEARPDVLHAHGLKAALLCAAVRLALPPSRRPALAVSVHTFPFHRPRGLDPARRWLLRGVARAWAGAALLPVSGAVAAWLRRHAGLRPRRVLGPPLALPAGAPDRSAARRALGLPADLQLVGFVGRLSREKGADVLLTAWAGLGTETRRRSRLVLLGDGPERVALQRLATSLGIAGEVVWLGHIPGAGSLLRAFDLLAIPSRSEGLGLVALEALALGVPVAAARTGGLPEVLRQGAWGALLPPEDAGAWAEALRRYLVDPSALPRGGDPAAAWVQRAFSPERVSRRTLAVYLGLLRPGGSGT